MATLKLQQKKSFSEQNMRKIINLIIGLQSSVNEASSQCLRNYIDDGSRTYSKNEICIHDGYIWEALTVTQGAWDSSKWTKIGTDEFTELDLDTIKSYLNLSQDELDNLQNLIDDSQITLTKTHSSSKIYADIQQCLEDSKTYTLKEISKLSGASYKVVASTSEMTSESIIYLLPNATTYDMYIVEENGTKTRIGDTTINLDNYLTKTEIETDYLKKTDADSKYATITTVDGKVNKTDILTANSSSATDDQVYSAKAINTEVVKKTDISTTIDSSSTDDTVPTNKSVWNSLYKICDTNILADANNPTSKFCIADLTTLNTPAKEGMTGAQASLIISIEDRDNWNGQISITMAEPSIFIRSVGDDSIWTKWKKILTETDVPKRKVVHFDGITPGTPITIEGGTQEAITFDIPFNPDTDLFIFRHAAPNFVVINYSRDDNYKLKLWLANFLNTNNTVGKLWFTIEYNAITERNW